MSDITPFARFQAKEKLRIRAENPETPPRKILIDCLRKWNEMPESDKVVYSFDNFDEMVCSCEDNGSVVINQPWYHCKTCWPENPTKGCCIVCAKRCHKGHDLEYQGWCECYCDCALSGKCQNYHPEKPVISEIVKGPKKKGNESLINIPKGNGKGFIPKTKFEPSEFKAPEITFNMQKIGFKSNNITCGSVKTLEVEIPKCFWPETRMKEDNQQEQNVKEETKTDEEKPEIAEEENHENKKPKLENEEEKTKMVVEEEKPKEVKLEEKPKEKYFKPSFGAKGGLDLAKAKPVVPKTEEQAEDNTKTREELSKMSIEELEALSEKLEKQIEEQSKQNSNDPQ